MQLGAKEAMVVWAAMHMPMSLHLSTFYNLGNK
jgi:hypothetical protein